MPEAVTVGAGDFTGTSTTGFGIAAEGGYSNGVPDDLGAPRNLAIGPNGNFYVLEVPDQPGTTTDSIVEYLPNFNCMGPVATLNGVISGVTSNESLAVDTAGYVYVANQDPRQIAMYAPLSPGQQSSAPVATIQVPNNSTSTYSLDRDPIDVALDSTGRIYVANTDDSSILVYPARSGSTLSSTLAATIAGSATMMQVPNAIALDSAGKIYVLAYDAAATYAIMVFPANPVGTLDEAPLAQIAGTQTQLDAPISLAVDHLGIIYVGNYTSANPGQNFDILEFPANPSGTVDEAPQGVLTTIGATNVGNPVGLAAK